jgi:hypothetical protein
MAAADLSREQRDPLQAVANVASKKIDEAIAFRFPAIKNPTFPTPYPQAR